jgi:hypothetical protein
MRKPADRIIWTQELQFAALQDGWAILRHGSTNQTATLVNYIDYAKARPYIMKFPTPEAALAHVQARASSNDHPRLYILALAFLKQQATFQEKGSWEPSCGKGGPALERFYRRMAKEKRDAYRFGNRVPEHQQPMLPPPAIKFNEWDQHEAAKDGWVLAHSPLENRVMPRTCDKTVFATDLEAEVYVEHLAAYNHSIGNHESIECIAIEFRDRWRKDGLAAARRAHWGRNARRKAQAYIRGWYKWRAPSVTADVAKGEKVVTNTDGEKVVLTAEQLKPLPPPKRSP